MAQVPEIVLPLAAGGGEAHIPIVDAGEQAGLVRALTRRLIARAGADASGPDVAPAAIQTACESAVRELTRWVGATGAHTLLTRALAEARAQHPALKDIRAGSAPVTTLDGVPASVQAHGAPAVTAALAAVLETMVSLLGRLVGDDMAARLVDQGASDPSQNSEDAQ